MSGARRDPGGTWTYVVDRPAGWSRPAWMAVRMIDAAFHRSAYGRLRVPGLARLEAHQPLRGWCDAVTGIGPPVRGRRR